MTVQSLLTVVVGWSVTDDHSFPNMCARKDGDTGPSVSCTPASSFNPPMVERGGAAGFLYPSPIFLTPPRVWVRRGRSN